MPLVIEPNANFTGAGVTQAQFKTRFENLLNELRTYGVAFADVRGMKNRLVNGAFGINQTGATSAADAAYHFDQWYALNESGNVTVAQQTLQEAGQRTNLRMTQPDVAAKRLGIAQPIEAANCQDLRSSSVILSARIRCSSSQAIRYAILEHTGTADTITRDVVNSWTNATFTPANFFIAGVNVLAVGSTTPAANTWASISLGATVGAAANNLIVMVWSEGTLAQNATLDLGRVQLEAGTVATPCEVRPVGIEVALCQRYWCQSYERGTPPGTIVTASRVVYQGTSNGTAQPYTYYSFPVVMRATPTVTTYSHVTGVSGKAAKSGVDVDSVIPEVVAHSVVVGTNNTTNSNNFAFHFTASARL